MVINVAITQILCFYGVILQRPCNLRVTTFLKRKKDPFLLKGCLFHVRSPSLLWELLKSWNTVKSLVIFFCLGIAEQCSRMELCEGTEDAGMVHSPVKFTFTIYIPGVTGGAGPGNFLHCLPCFILRHASPVGVRQNAFPKKGLPSFSPFLRVTYPAYTVKYQITY